MAGAVEAIPEAWKSLVRSLGTEQLVDAIYVALDDFNARERDNTIPAELWRRLGDRAAAYKNPFVGDGSGSVSSAGDGEVERIKIKLVAVGGEDGGRTSSDSSEDAVADLLRDLQAVPMTFETLEATKIGKTVSGLRKHSSEKVRGLAAALYKNWKALVDEHLSRSNSNKPPAPAKTASADGAADHAKANTASAHKPAPAAAPTKTASAFTAADHAKKNTSAADKPAPAAAPTKNAAADHSKKANMAAADKPATKAAPKTIASNKRKEAPAQEEAKLEAARKKLRERYKEEEASKKQRKIQMINTPGDAKQRPVVVERRRVVAMANRAPVRCLRRMKSALSLSSYLHQISDDWDSYGQRYWMCRNYSYSPEKPKPVPKGRKGKAKIPVKWIDKEMSEFDKRLIKSWRERQEEREERQRQRAAKEKAERERREELELRELARLNREKEERAEDRSRKLARAQRAKYAGSEAARKGKYPRCTQ
uniref:TFIIS N-terminal domain-containing protein n=1 Tax=Oryza punctata TaxID=4537 RepID=A0A0E0M619_ORYPU